MSHFSVIVVTPDYPTEDVLTNVLQPFHEFECTGIDDKYVQDVDVTAQYRKDYESTERTRLRAADGTLHEPWADHFYREPTPEEMAKIGPVAGTGVGNGLMWTSKDWGDGRGYRAKIRFVPADMTEVSVLIKDIESFAEYVAGDGKQLVPCGGSPNLVDTHKYGYALQDASGAVIKVIDRTNPNKKWDYWRVGGRYTGKFKPLVATEAARAELSWEWRDSQNRPLSGVDICQKLNLDKHAMKAMQVSERQKWCDECATKAKLTFDQLHLACAELVLANKVWQTMPEPRPRGQEYNAWLTSQGYALAATANEANWELPEPAPGQTLAAWIAAAPWLTGFALLRDGQWYAEGRMGWWACVSDEQADWPATFQKLIDEVPEEHWLTVVDCHI